jgi:hypothetical protein
MDKRGVHAVYWSMNGILTVQRNFKIVSREQFHTSCSFEENRSNSNIFLGINNKHIQQYVIWRD